jgi:hypothetical protein
MIVSEHGIEFTSNAILAWSKDHVIDWCYIGHDKSKERSRAIIWVAHL